MVSLRTPVYSTAECAARVRDAISAFAKHSDVPLAEIMVRYIEDGLCSGGAQIRYEVLTANQTVEDGYTQQFGAELVAMHYSATWAWLFTQNVFEADPEFGAELVKSTYNGKDTQVSRELFMRLVGHPILIPTDNKSDAYAGMPEEEWKRIRRTGSLELGLLVAAHPAPDGSLVVTCSCVSGTDFYIPFVLTRFHPGEETLGMAECLGRAEIPELDITNHLIGASVTALAFTLYALSDTDEGTAFRGKRYIPLPRPTKKGNRLYPPAKPHIYSFGKEVGEAIRRYNAESAGRTIESDGTSTVRPHIRSAHWHSYWYGPRNSEERECRLVWVAPIFVKSHETVG